MQTKSFDEQLKSFFNELAPRLETAKALDRELDRKLAHRFNVVDYLRKDELGLSRIIADLLNPGASHGQGMLFLRAFLEKLPCSGKGPEWPDLNSSGISVSTEKRTENRRQIDIVVVFEGPDGETCLAFENKPYALDQEDQVRDYLGSLKELYPGGFLLIYLPPRGEGPSESSIHKDELKKWGNHFAIMPYVGGQKEWKDEFDDFRLPHSLADWLRECWKNCEVDRLRWFLRDMETFCQRRFGDQAMTTDSEATAVTEYLKSHPDRLDTAAAVHRSWPGIRDKVCREFLERLGSRIEEAARKSDVLARFAADIEVAAQGYYIHLCPKCWKPGSGRGTRITLATDGSAPNGWYFCVWSPRSKEERKRQDLEKELADGLPAGRSTKPLAWRELVREDWKNWDSLVPELVEENQGNGRTITEYFLERFITVAEVAVPIIDRIEDPGKA